MKVMYVPATRPTLKLSSLFPMRRKLTGPRVYLRRFSVADAPAWARLMIENREWLKRWSPPLLDGLQTEDAEEAIRLGHAEARAWTRLDTGIFRIGDEALIGKISLHNIMWGILRSAGFGFYVGEAFAGNGYMREALAMLSAFAFRECRLHRLWAGVQLTNLPSQKVFDALGFTREGIHRREIFIEGKWRDQYHYSLLAEDFRRLAPMWARSGWLTDA